MLTVAFCKRLCLYSAAYWECQPIPVPIKWPNDHSQVAERSFARATCVSPAVISANGGALFLKLADPDAAARKLVEIANAVEAVQDGRIYVERVNEPFLAGR
jgi:hypothetical protein